MGSPPAPKTAKLALVLGGARCVWDDLRALEQLYGREWDGLVLACNDVAVHWPKQLDHWATLHAEKLGTWKKERALAGHPGGYITWGRKNVRGVDRAVQPWGGGSSGMLAVQVAVELRCERVVLCGIPLSRMPHFAESRVHLPTRIWSSAESHFRAWTKPDVKKRMTSRVKSMSGRTAELLGKPTREWLGVKEDIA